MKITTNVFGSDLAIKQPFTLDLDSPTLRDVLQALKKGQKGPWNRVIREDLSLEEGCVILVNGRNVATLDRLDTNIKEGDEITLTVLVAGG